ncbi:MAG: DnaD domain-containing protein, partial [Dehalococcoidia bacterium]
GDGAEQTLERGLKGAVGRGLLLSLEMEAENHRHRLYFVNTESDREALDKVRTGELSLGALPADEPSPGEAPADIFGLYEENIGVLTPLVADRMKEAEALYPASWIAEAIEEAVNHNARSWSYIEAILRRWASEGRDSGEDRRHPGKDEDTQKYFRDRYGNPIK